MPHVQSTFAIDATLRQIATQQLGVITVDQAKRRGVNRNALARRREAGALVPVFREAMRLAPFSTTPSQRVLAASLVVPGSVIAATSAAIVHQLPLPGHVAHSHDVVLSVVGASRVVRVPGITAVRHTTPLPSTRWLTTRVATPAATLVLLPRYLDADEVERCLDHALAHRLCTVATVKRLLERTPPQSVHGRRLLLGLLDDRAGGIGHRSATEQHVGRWLKRAGFSGWVRNFRVRVDAHSTDVEVDFGWPAQRIALEVSPFFTHGSRATQQRDMHRRRLLVHAGWRVVEAADDDLATPRAFTRTIASLRALGAS
jgi:very-short-patch-repair endonuclease